MPTFIAVHKWKPEEQVAVIKEAIGLYKALDEGKWPGVELCATYMAGTGGYQAFCVWKAKNPQELKKVVATMPTMGRSTELIPVMQSAPPTMEYVLALWQQMIQPPTK